VRTARLGWSLIQVLCLAACASVSVRPAHRAPDGDEREGMPFYLQRPYVVIEQEIPIEGSEGYLAANYDPRLKRYYLTSPVPGELAQVTGLDKVGIPFESVAVLNESVVLGEPFTDVETKDETEKPATEKDAGTQSSESNVASASGTLKWDSTVPQVLREGKAISIVFLPDLDEKYVVSVRGGLGTADSKVALGPGGTANQFEANVDNREVGRFIFDEVAKFTNLAVDLIKVKRKLLAPAVPLGETEADVEVKDKPLVPALLRYIYVGFAVPGMYPILKNSEYGPEAGCFEWSGMATFSSPDPFLRGAQWPFTRYAVRMRREFLLYIEDFKNTPSVVKERKAATLAQAGKDLRAFCEALPSNIPIEVSFAMPGPQPTTTKVTLKVTMDCEETVAANEGQGLEDSSVATAFVFRSDGFTATTGAAWEAVYDPAVGKPLIDKEVRKQALAFQGLNALGKGPGRFRDRLRAPHLSAIVVIQTPPPGNAK
jgi:hypothetical protein